MKKIIEKKKPIFQGEFHFYLFCKKYNDFPKEILFCIPKNGNPIVTRVARKKRNLCSHHTTSAVPVRFIIIVATLRNYFKK